MPTVIVSSTDTITPSLMLGFESSRAGRSNVHPIIGRSDDDVTLRPSGPRSGHVELLFADPGNEQDSLDAENMLGAASAFTVVSDERESVQMSFIVTGDLKRTLDPQTRDAWIIAFDWTEVAV